MVPFTWYSRKEKQNADEGLAEAKGVGRGLTVKRQEGTF